MKTVIVSDIHIGSVRCELEAFKSFLFTLECDRLIIAGDLFDLWDEDAETLRQKHKSLQTFFDRLYAKKVIVEYLLGNHDSAYLEDPVLDTNTVPVRPHFTAVRAGKRKVAVIHGHQFDHMMLWYYPLYRLSSWTRKVCEHLFMKPPKPRAYDAPSYFKDRNSYQRLKDGMREKARRHYGKMGFDVLVMGHLHTPEHVRGDGRIEYVNAGEWKGSNTYVEIDGESVKLMHYSL